MPFFLVSSTPASLSSSSTGSGVGRDGGGGAVGGAGLTEAANAGPGTGEGGGSGAATGEGGAAGPEKGDAVTFNLGVAFPVATGVPGTLSFKAGGGGVTEELPGSLILMSC